MFDINLIRKDLDNTKQRVKARNFDPSVIDKIYHLDILVRQLMVQEQSLTNNKNKLSKTIPELAKTNKEEQLKVLAELNTIKQEIETISEQLTVNKKELDSLLLTIPNVADESVPVGKSEDDNVEIKRVFEPTKFDFEPLAHWDLAAKNELVDFEKAAKLTGSRFSVYTKDGAKLYRALQRFCLAMNTNAGYEEIIAPVIVNQDSLIGSGNLPKFAEDLFKLENSNYYLSPTAEVQLVNLHRNEILKASDLPKKFTALSACFRSEAGSAGRDMRGVIRQHQFHKVELVQLTKPEDSFNALELMVSQAESILEALKLPYRRLLLCTADMGFSSAKTYDLEV